MIYIKNEKDYALGFKVSKDGREKMYEFDCFRRYSDTGNVVTTGVTPLSEEDFDWLYENCKQFKKFVDKGYLKKTKKSGATEAANKMDALEKENEILKKQLEEKTKEASTATNEEMDNLKKENESLKKQLEAAAKKSKGSKPTNKPEKAEETF